MSAYREGGAGAPLAHAVAPLWAVDGERELLGPCTLVRVDARVIAVASARTLARAGARSVGIGVRLEDDEVVPVRAPTMARYVGLRVLELADERTPWPSADVAPLRLDALGGIGAWSSAATVEAIGLSPLGRGCERVRVPVSPFEITVAARMGAGDERSVLRATAAEVPPPTWRMDGAPLLVRWAPSRLLGRPAQERIAAVACTAGVASLYVPAGTPAPWAELVPLEAGSFETARGRITC